MTDEIDARAAGFRALRRGLAFFAGPRYRRIRLLLGRDGRAARRQHGPDPETQIGDVFDSLQQHLAVAGLAFDDVVEMTSYHVGLREHLAAFMRVKDAHVRAPYPAWTAIGVSALIGERAIVEVRLIARRAAARP
jgi:enamine deaminase RidA (YjgF/YER057c/UK114 family)